MTESNLIEAAAICILVPLFLESIFSSLFLSGSNTLSAFRLTCKRYHRYELEEDEEG